MLRNQLKEVTDCIALINATHKAHKAGNAKKIQEMISNLPLKETATMTTGATLAVLSTLSRKPNAFTVAIGAATLLMGAINLEDYFKHQAQRKTEPVCRSQLHPSIRKQVHKVLTQHNIKCETYDVITVLEHLRVCERKINQLIAKSGKLDSKQAAEVRAIAAKSASLGMFALVNHIEKSAGSIIPHSAVVSPIRPSHDR